MGKPSGPASSGERHAGAGAPPPGGMLPGPLMLTSKLHSGVVVDLRRGGSGADGLPHSQRPPHSPRTLVALLAAPVAVCVSSEESGGGGRGRRHIDGSAATVPLGQRGGGTRVRSRSTPLFNNMCRSHDLMAFVPSKLHTCSAPALACAHAKLDSAHAFSHFTAVRSRLLSAPA